MFHYHPQNRPLLVDVIGHPWVQGDTATQAEIEKAFGDRHKVVNERVSAEFAKEDKRERRAPPEVRPMEKY